MVIRSAIGTAAVACTLVLFGCNDATSDVNNDSANNGETSNNQTTNNQTSNNMNTGANNVEEPDPPYEDCTVTVSPRDAADENYNIVQAALFEVEEGGVVCLVDGNYTFDAGLSLTTSNVEIRGESRDNTVLDFSQQETDPNGIKVQADGFKVASLTVRDAAGDGIRVDGADGVTFSDIRVEWTGGPSPDNGAYGIYPVQCNNVLVENTIVSGASDAGIYVGQSTNIIVRDNEVFENVAGIEIENSTDAEVVNNHAHDNTGGILVFNLPSPPVQGGARAKVHGNRIINNNEPNFAAEGNIVANVPTGTGILVLAADDNEFTDNEITGNISLGIAIISFQTFETEWQNDEFDPFSEGNYVHANTFENNGTDPKGDVAFIAGLSGAIPLEPLIWDGWVDEEKPDQESLTNCFWENVDENGDPAGYRNINAPSTFMEQSTDATDVTCEGTVLPTIDF